MHYADRPEEGLVLSDSERRAVHELEAGLLSDPVFAGAVDPFARALRTRAAPVVVGIPADGRAADAVEWATAEAARQRCPLRIVHAFRLPVTLDAFGVVPAVQALPTDRTVAAEAVGSAIARARSVAPGIEVSGHVIQGCAGPVLLRQSRDARLLVLGAGEPRPPRGALRRLVRNSLRTRVTVAARCPVTVVHDRFVTGQCATTPRILVGIDGGARSDEAVGFAFRAAHQRGIAVRAVHAWSAGPAGRTAGAAPPARTEVAAYVLVDAALARWREEYPDVPVDIEVVRRDPASALIAGSSGAALVVVGSRGHGWALGAVLGSLSGSVSRAVLDGAAGPVAVVRRTSGDAAVHRRASR
jgi:nucleotide-binding universal stress UspA family protein